MLVTLSNLPVQEIFPGIRARVVHTPATSQSWVELDQNAVFPDHRHPHEQTVNVLAGELELIVNGTPHRLAAGDSYVIPSEAPHSGRAITACRVLDVFSPVREEYRLR